MTGWSLARRTTFLVTLFSALIFTSSLVSFFMLFFISLGNTP
jgi:hypothetical protein